VYKRQALSWNRFTTYWRKPMKGSFPG